VDAGYVGTEEYQNKRMMLAAVLDSVYANTIVVGIVLIDVKSIVYYEFMESEQKDCFGREFPVQEMITLCCLSGCVIELLLRGFEHSWRQSYSFKSKNANTLFDGAVVAGLDPPFLSIVCGLFLPTLRTWRKELVQIAKCGPSLCKPESAAAECVLVCVRHVCWCVLDTNTCVCWCLLDTNRH